jgi:two-component system chemotaxis response regulator CheB
VGFEIVVIGSASGGLKSLQALLWGLSANFPLPLVMVQHRRRDSELGLCEFLRQHCRLPLSEPEDKELIVPGHAYLASRDYHLLIERLRNERPSFAMSTDRARALSRPSIDVLFESAAEAFGRNTIGVLLTGRNRDGLHGLDTIRKHGGLTLMVDSETNDPAYEKLEVDHVLPLPRMANFLENLIAPAAVTYGI